MIHSYADIENNPKTWTKVTGYNQLAVFKKLTKPNTVEISLHSYNVPYRSE